MTNTHDLLAAAREAVEAFGQLYDPPDDIEGYNAVKTRAEAALFALNDAVRAAETAVQRCCVLCKEGVADQVLPICAACLGHYESVPAQTPSCAHEWEWVSAGSHSFQACRKCDEPR